MAELTIEQKAERYDVAIKIAKSKIKNDKDHVLYEDDIIELFPELKESEDERIRGNIIATIHLYYGEPLEDEAKEMIAWLEKQGEHANFRSKIQIGDNVTRNKDGVLVNLSQLNRVAKKQCEQKPAEWSEEIEAAISLLKHIAEEQEKDYCPHNANALRKAAQYLESIRPQNTWKPSDEQIDTLEYYMHNLICNEHKEVLFGLYADLKKLREE